MANRLLRPAEILNGIRKAVPRPSKYRNSRTFFDGIKFASRKEARVYGWLKLRERQRDISELRLQVPYALQVNGEIICTYRADFVYLDRNGKEVVADAKGYRTREYLMKRKLMKAIHGIEIREL